MMDQDTIAAISTAVSESGIGIIRISGSESIPCVDKIFRSRNPEFSLAKAPGYTMHYGFIHDGQTQIDEVLVSVFRAPRSYTAEDTIEINCHGGIYAMKRVLETVLKQGVRAAQPGEFTKRAFLNGRIDLTRAEAVMDVIQAKNEFALRQSVQVLKGALYRRIGDLRKEILYETAKIEAALDDPEHYELDGYTEVLHNKNRTWMKKIRALADSADHGRLIREGIQTAIIGRPNAGKSSLMNALLGEERAIVTEVEGTTRDVLSENISLPGITLRIMDTAGIRKTSDKVETIGVERAKKSLSEADLVLAVIDSSGELGENDLEILRLISEKKTVMLLNKTDLSQVVSQEDIKEAWKRENPSSPLPPILEISAKEEEGIDRLEETILSLFSMGEISFNDEVMITSIRQKQKLLEAGEALERVQQGIEEGFTEDFLSIDLTEAFQCLGEITGETAGEDLINEIFEQFCMGK